MIKYSLRVGHVGVMFGDMLGKALDTVYGELGTGIFKTCASCTHMAKVGPAKCAKFLSTPPIDIIMTGCNDYLDVQDDPDIDEIPF